MNLAMGQDKSKMEREPCPAPSEMHPLVSCIMPTHNRRPFVSQAIKYFLCQGYPNRELIIIDDGNDVIQDLVPQDPRIRYLRQEHKSNVGAKRNLACQEAKGELIVHWDDDDWMADWRLSYQVQSLLSAQADICGLSTLLFYDLCLDQAWQYRYPRAGPAWLAGGTFCYTKAFWRAYPFPEVSAGEDTRFILSIPSKKMLILEDPSFYVILIHPGNTSSRVIPGKQWRSYPVTEIRALLGTDVDFYRHSLRQGRNDVGHQQSQSQQPLSIGDVWVSRQMPLVSCIMPTYNRRHFVRMAVNYFLQQDYPNKELIVVDDGTDPVHDIMPADPQIRYVPVETKQSVGAKRNRAVQAARGEFIVHWDDDDWYASRRLTEQIQKLLQKEADVVALSMRYVLSLSSMDFWCCRPELHSHLHFRDVCCGTIAYRRTLWERYGPYPPVNCGEDAYFLKALPDSAVRLCSLADEEMFLCVRHGYNTWDIVRDWNNAPHGWEKMPAPLFLPLPDYKAYIALAQSVNAKIKT